MTSERGVKRQAQDSRPEEIERPGRGQGFYLSLLLHTAIVVVCFVGLDWGVHEIAPTPPGDNQVMNVTSVDPSAVAREVEKLKAADQAKQREADRKVKEAEQQRRKEEEALEKLKTEKENLKREKEAENKRLEEEKQRLQQEKDKAAQEKQKVEQEKQKAIAEKKKLEEEQKKATEKKKADDARKQEDDKKKAAAEDARKKDADAKKKAEDAKKQAARDAEAKRKASEAKALQDELAAEEAAMAAAAQGKQDASALAKYTAAIMRQVADNFVAPDINSGLKCTLLVRMIPSGEVVEARVVKSSGNATFDRQAELAVRKASPLPVPDEPRLFEQMRTIQFEFDPSEVR